uniref:Uncharacterized protein n=1 Tax=Arundo donax TaxID=35708 RepID=A0A0A9E3H8_ARUDO
MSFSILLSSRSLCSSTAKSARSFRACSCDCLSFIVYSAMSGTSSEESGSNSRGTSIWSHCWFDPRQLMSGTSSAASGSNSRGISICSQCCFATLCLMLENRSSASVPNSRGMSATSSFLYSVA